MTSSTDTGVLITNSPDTFLALSVLCETFYDTDMILIPLICAMSVLRKSAADIAHRGDVYGRITVVRMSDQLISEAGLLAQSGRRAAPVTGII